MSKENLLKAKEAMARTGIPRSSWYEKCEELGMPPVRIYPGSRQGLRWRESDIDRFLAGRIEERDKQLRAKRRLLRLA